MAWKKRKYLRLLLFLGVSIILVVGVLAAVKLHRRVLYVGLPLEWSNYSGLGDWYDMIEEFEEVKKLRPEVIFVAWSNSPLLKSLNASMKRSRSTAINPNDPVVLLRKQDKEGNIQEEACQKQDKPKMRDTRQNIVLQ
jgi:AmiR/NasT family two-component response regulator